MARQQRAADFAQPRLLLGDELQHEPLREQLLKIARFWLLLFSFAFLFVCLCLLLVCFCVLCFLFVVYLFCQK